MKKLFTTLLLAVMAVTAFAQSRVYETCTVKSSILGMDRNYAVYLPDGYDKTDRSYPVLYLLHGLSDDHTGWIQFGKVQYITDKAIAEGKASEMIIVMPDADTKRPGYFNDISGKYDYEDFFFNELIPHIEKTYRVRSRRDYRAVAGLSMGGGGTLYYALHHPEMFGAACPMSGYFGVESEEEMRNPQRLSVLVPNVEDLSNQTITDYFTRHNAAAYMASLSEDELAAVKEVSWYITCGDDDFLIEGNNNMYHTFRKYKIPAQYRVKDGAHTWGYWRMELEVVLGVVSASFSR